jgi:hypothetical protein
LGHIRNYYTILNLKRRDHLEDIDVDGRKVLRQTLKEEGGKGWHL